MPESYEQAVDEQAARDDSDPGPEEELFDADVEVKTVEELKNGLKSTVETVPDFLKPEVDRRDPNRPELPGFESPDFDFDLGELDTFSTNKLLQILVQIEVVQLETLFNISDSVEPFNSITVSGTNAIDDANTAEPVVPKSDDEQIPTRELMIRSDPENDEQVYFGDDEVRPNSGFVLLPGEMITLETDLRAEELYMASSESGEQVQLLGVI